MKTKHSFYFFTFIIALLTLVFFSVGIREFLTGKVHANVIDTTLTIINTAPEFTVQPSEIVASTNSSPTNANSIQGFSATASEPNNGSYYFIVCKTDVVTPGGGSVPSCATSQLICVSSPTASQTQATCNYTAQNSDPQVVNWYAFVCNANNCSESSQGTGDNGSPMEVNHAPAFSVIIANTDDTAFPGDSLAFTTVSSDSDTFGTPDEVKLIICASQGATSTGCTVSGDLICMSSSSSSNPTCNYSVPSIKSNGVYNYYSYVFDTHGFASSNSPFPSKSITVQNVAPVVESVALNGGNSINLTASTSTTVSVTGVVNDNNGCFDIQSVESAVYESELTKDLCNSVAHSDPNKCYPKITCVQDSGSCVTDPADNTLLFSGSDSSASYTCDVNIEFYAESQHMVTGASFGFSVVQTAGLSDMPLWGSTQDTDYVYSTLRNNRVVRVSKADVTNQQEFLYPTDFFSGVTVTVDQNYVYVGGSYTTNPADPFNSQKGGILRISKSDFTTYNLVSLNQTNKPYGLVNDSTNLYAVIGGNPSKVVIVNKGTFTISNTITTNVNGSQAITVDENYIYTAGSWDETISRINKSTFAENLLNLGQLPDTRGFPEFFYGFDDVWSLIGDANYLYVTSNSVPGMIVRVQKSDFDTVSYLQFGDISNDIALEITQDADYVYLAIDYEPGRVDRIRKSDFTVVGSVTMPANANWIEPITADSTHVYAFSTYDPFVMKISTAASGGGSTTHAESILWEASMTACDKGGLCNTNTSTTVVINPLVAYDVIETEISYGQLMPGQNNPTLTRAATLQNRGNVILDQTVYGIDMADNEGHTIPVDNQKISLTSGVEYSLGTSLSTTPAIMQIGVPKPINSTIPSKQSFWGLKIPSNTYPNPYTGTVSIIGNMSDQQ